jgi:predicted aspartyl protease
MMIKKALNVLDMHMIGSNLSVFVNIWDKTNKKFKKGSLTFDTGASMTTISKDILFDLGYDVENGKTHLITTASGVAYVNEVTLDKIRLGDCLLENVTAYAHTFPSESLTVGVIGLNILSQFDITLQFSQRLIHLSRI